MVLFSEITPKFSSTHNGCRKFWKRLVIKVLQNVLTLRTHLLIEVVYDVIYMHSLLSAL